MASELNIFALPCEPRLYVKPGNGLCYTCTCRVRKAMLSQLLQISCAATTEVGVTERLSV